MGVSQMKRAISQKRWKQRIVECRNSGVPVKEWCRKQGISYSTYYRHEQALLKCAQDPSDIPILEQAPQTLPVPFVEVTKMCQATFKTHTDSIVIQVSAPGFRLKITGNCFLQHFSQFFAFRTVSSVKHLRAASAALRIFVLMNAD